MSLTERISQATGAEFSDIPAQNATGNWVKVTQRIPVRIAIERRADDLHANRQTVGRKTAAQAHRRQAGNVEWNGTEGSGGPALVL